MQNGTIYRINHIGGSGTLRVSEAAADAWKAEILPPFVNQN
jgi:hypothetical protein